MSQRKISQYKVEHEQSAKHITRRKSTAQLLNSLNPNSVKIVWRKAKSHPDLTLDDSSSLQETWKVSRKPSSNNDPSSPKQKTPPQYLSSSDLSSTTCEFVREPLRRSKSFSYVRPVIKSHISSDVDLDISNLPSVKALKSKFEEKATEGKPSVMNSQTKTEETTQIQEVTPTPPTTPVTECNYDQSKLSQVNESMFADMKPDSCDVATNHEDERPFTEDKCAEEKPSVKKLAALFMKDDDNVNRDFRRNFQFTKSSIKSTPAKLQKSKSYDKPQKPSSSDHTLDIQTTQQVSDEQNSQQNQEIITVENEKNVEKEEVRQSVRQLRQLFERTERSTSAPPFKSSRRNFNNNKPTFNKNVSQSITNINIPATNNSNEALTNYTTSSNEIPLTDATSTSLPDNSTKPSNTLKKQSSVQNLRVKFENNSDVEFNHTYMKKKSDISKENAVIDKFEGRNNLDNNTTKVTSEKTDKVQSNSFNLKKQFSRDKLYSANASNIITSSELNGINMDSQVNQYVSKLESSIGSEITNLNSDTQFKKSEEVNEDISANEKEIELPNNSLNETIVNIKRDNPKILTTKATDDNLLQVTKLENKSEAELMSHYRKQEYLNTDKDEQNSDKASIRLTKQKSLHLTEELKPKLIGNSKKYNTFDNTSLIEFFSTTTKKGDDVIKSAYKLPENKSQTKTPTDYVKKDTNRDLDKVLSEDQNKKAAKDVAEIKQPEKTHISAFKKAKLPQNCRVLHQDEIRFFSERGTKYSNPYSGQLKRSTSDANYASMKIRNPNIAKLKTSQSFSQNPKLENPPDSDNEEIRDFTYTEKDIIVPTAGEFKVVDMYSDSESDGDNFESDESIAKELLKDLPLEPVSIIKNDDIVPININEDDLQSQNEFLKTSNDLLSNESDQNLDSFPTTHVLDITENDINHDSVLSSRKDHQSQSNPHDTNIDQCSDSTNLTEESQNLIKENKIINNDRVIQNNQLKEQDQLSDVKSVKLEQCSPSDDDSLSLTSISEDDVRPKLLTLSGSYSFDDPDEDSEIRRSLMVNDDKFVKFGLLVAAIASAIYVDIKLGVFIVLYIVAKICLLIFIHDNINIY